MGDNGALTALLLLLKIQVIWDVTLRLLQLSYETSATMNQSTSLNVSENLDIQQNLILLTFPISIISRNKPLKVYYYYYYYYYYSFCSVRRTGHESPVSIWNTFMSSSTNCCKVKPTSANVATPEQHNSEPVVSYRPLLYFKMSHTPDTLHSRGKSFC
jgi:hypothetical protein